MPVDFNNVYYTYQEGTPFSSAALNDINLHFDDHEFIALIGHTGSGKSTLAQLLNALLKPTKGSIKVDEFSIIAGEKKVKGLKNLKKHAAMVFQFPEYQLFEETVLKDVSFGPKNFGLSEEEATQKAKEALALVGIDEEYYEKSPFELSGGQKRRVAIAGIIALEPSILILDEATCGLDPLGEKNMMKLFKEIYDKGITIIMISHNMDIVLKYASRSVVLNKGKIIYNGTPQELFIKDNLFENYNLHEPKVIEYAKELKNRGVDLNIANIKDIESLAKEIKRAKNG